MSQRFEPIAVVGQSCVLPGALSPAELWSAVAAGRDLISTAPEGRWGLPRELAIASAERRSPDQAWHDRGGYVRGFEDVFDAQGFTLPAAEILGLDPLFQWLLYAGREALSDAGHDAGLSERTGIVLGNLSFPSVGASRFAESVWLGDDRVAGDRVAGDRVAGDRVAGDRPGGDPADPRNHFNSGLPAQLLARALGLGGGAFALDAACASSLVAVKLACDRLHDGRADAMLAGAVSCADDLFIHVGFCALEALSPSGRSRPFHRGADGLLPAEGAVFVVLRRLSDAITRGDRILGVIRGVGLSNDGRGGGLLAPSEEGQGRALEKAYDQAGLSPADVSLIECHATGTRVGDAAEIRSLGRLYGSRREVPIGSLKSNLGHLITAAGLAGLLKVLAAIRARTRPPTLHAERPNPALEGSPFRLLAEAEPWPSDGPRRAAISAFGFGGNNAHLLVEEWRAESKPTTVAVPAPRREAPIAVVGLAAAAAGAADSGATDAFARVLFSGDSRLRPDAAGQLQGRMETIELPLVGLGFPPNDLKQTLPQQLLLLATARHAMDGLESDLPRERTGILIGMRCDAEIARWGLRWRLAGRLGGGDRLRDARDGVIDGLRAAGVVGTMPNMTANRLNHQLDLGGASASVSSEELSGLTALDLALRALRSGELDAAVVGAADLCCEPVHEAAVRALIGDRAPGDAAVVLVLKRLEDARRDGDRVFAVVEGGVEEAEGVGEGLRLVTNPHPPWPPSPIPPPPDRERGEGRRCQAAVDDVSETSAIADPPALDLSRQLGHSHAASSLLHVAAAALICHHRTIPARGLDAGTAGVSPASGAESAGSRSPGPWLHRERRAEVSARSFTGRAATVHLRDDPASARGSLPPAGGFPRICLYSGADRAEVLERLRADRRDDPAAESGPARLALVAGSDAELAERREQARGLLAGEAASPARGVYFRETPAGGELAFVFTGAGAAYRGMGCELLAAMPGLLDRLDHRMSDLPAAAGWVYEPANGRALEPLEQLWGSSFLTQVHVELSRGELGLAPAAVLGYSSGESNSLMATGAWKDLDALHRDTVECGLFTSELGGDFAAVHRLWGDDAEWSNWVLSAPVTRVREALAGEDKVYLTLISSPEDVAIGGDAAACRRVIDKLGATAYPLGYDLAVHCPVVEGVAERWLDLHRRETNEVPGVRFYTHSTLDSYRPTRESAAQAILGQAVRTLDFPALVGRAWDDGVRIFLEHGPRGLCSGWIRKTLASRGVSDADYLAVSLDRAGGSSLRHTAETVAQLLAAGVVAPHGRQRSAARWAAFHRPAETSQKAGKTLTFPAHWPPVKLPEEPPLSEILADQREPTTMPTLNNPQLMPLAPSLPPVLDDFVAQTIAEPAIEAEPAPVAAPALPAPEIETPAIPLVAAPAASPSVTTASVETATPPAVVPAGDPVRSAVLANVSDLQARIGSAHREYLSSQTALHQQFLAVRQKALAELLKASRTVPPAETRGYARPSLTGRSTAVAVDQEPIPPASGPGPVPEIERATAVSMPQVEPSPSSALARASKPVTPTPDLRRSKPHVPIGTDAHSPGFRPGDDPAAAGELPGPKYSRQDLEVLASGRISTLFGPLFERQDGYARQTRMPEPPFLLADRVTGIDAEAGSMRTGTIWTETDVTDESWYLHRRRMPGGLMIEAGQADLLLISWLGADFLNRGERIYRLLGCELTWRGGLPEQGDTLVYDIHVDGHANQGDVRLFFFHYDCRIDGEVRLEVRHGQAGFFTDQELAESAGVLWDPLEETPTGEPPAPPPALSEHRSFAPEQMAAFSEGRPYECFGAGFELAAPHTLTPTIQSGRMLLLDRVTDFLPEGGPWRRGYLRAVTAIRPDSWIFEGHFKNDPCMPGTLMLEGCFQAMSFYLAATGFTLDRDGWRFEPVPDETYAMRCRGQVVPGSNELVYELFVHTIEAGPQPTLYADLLCTVDGLKAFHARRLGLRLVPDWPLDVHPELSAQPFPGGERPQGRRIADVGGFRFDYPSLLACAWGRPSDAFGEMYRVFDSPRKVARLPGPPYHFMSRIAQVQGEMGRFTPGAELEAEYDVPPDAWYFSENGFATMPFAVLMEAGLQPCGWLASYIGSALTTDIDLQFRNLDGTGTLTSEITPDSGIIKSRVKLTATSSSAGVLIVRFEVAMRDDRGDVFSMQTAFGFFPAEAMTNQVGLPPSEEERAGCPEGAQTEHGEASSDFMVDLTSRPERTSAGGARLAGRKLLMLDRVTGFWPEAGKAGLGRMRAVKDVDPGEWFFKAHFFTDPVQPGSLGIEAMVQLLQFYMLHTGMGEGLEKPRFEPLGTDMPLTWKYRGQVLPTNRLITTELEVTETGSDERGVYAVADAWLWVDGKRIYAAKNLGMRMVGIDKPSDEPSPPLASAPGRPSPQPPSPPTGRGGRAAGADTTASEELETPRQAKVPAPTTDADRGTGSLVPFPPGVEDREEGNLLDPAAEPWILDHCPTWTLPALPMMSLVDRLAAAAQAHLADLRVVGLEDVSVARWVSFPNGPVRLRAEVVSEERQGSEKGSVEVRLEVWRDAATPALSRFETAATGRVLMARTHCPPPKPVAPLDGAEAVGNPYASGALFHGPAFQLLRRLEMSGAGSSALLDAAGGSVPYGTLHPALLDAATHGIPHDALSRWCAEIPGDVVAYPRRLRHARFYAPAPAAGEVRCEARFEGYQAASRTAVFHLQMLTGDVPWADMRLEEVLLPKGPLGLAPAGARRAFLRDRIPTPGLGLARFDGENTRFSESEAAASDWLPGTVARAYGVAPAASRDALTREVAIKDHVARHAGVHPATVSVTGDVPAAPEAEASGVAAIFPLTRFEVSVRHQDGELSVRDAGPPKIDLDPLRRYWSDYLGIEDWPVEDVYYGLIERFVRRVVVTDPRGLAQIYGRSTLFLANHQVMIESLLFSIVASALVGTPTVTLAKDEHRATWLGQLIAHCFSYPGVADPEVIAFFERENMRSLPLIIRKLGKRMKTEARSVAVHCEGTRSLTCRKPVAALAGSFVDMAMKAGAAIVPVRFTGGLPAEPLSERLRFPLGHGRQDYWLGSPITPEELEQLRYKDRRQAVMEAINALGPSNDSEEPLPGDPAFAAEVDDWVARTGIDPAHATIYKTVEQLERPGREVRRLIEAAGSGRLVVSGDARDRWLAELARRLFGERGPKIEVRSE